jgi:hypothetical protein
VGVHFRNWIQQQPRGRDPKRRADAPSHIKCFAPDFAPSAVDMQHANRAAASFLSFCLSFYFSFPFFFILDFRFYSPPFFLSFFVSLCVGYVNVMIKGLFTRR